jgi:hypothetical protein
MVLSVVVLTLLNGTCLTHHAGASDEPHMRLPIVGRKLRKVRLAPQHAEVPQREIRRQNSRHLRSVTSGSGNGCCTRVQASTKSETSCTSAKHQPTPNYTPVTHWAGFDWVTWRPEFRNPRKIVAFLGTHNGGPCGARGCLSAAARLSCGRSHGLFMSTRTSGDQTGASAFA